MNRQILRIAVPSIVSNIVVPLLGLMDLTIAGHIGETAFIGAVSVGATMFNLTYWNFGFLRMGTSGITAQAFGRKDNGDILLTLSRSVFLAVVIGVAIIALQYPLSRLLLLAISPSDEVQRLVIDYFGICVWGAPAILATMSISGWFVGMQNSVYPMTVAIVVNVVNIVVSLLCVFAFDMGFIGIAVGTLAAQWSGFLLSLVMARKMLARHAIATVIEFRKVVSHLGGFFKVNGDIFFRSLCMMSVVLFFTSAGARSGDTILAVNALIMQLFIIYSYFMDGFAYAGEALVGRYYGERNYTDLGRCVKRLFLWGVIVMSMFSIAYTISGSGIMRLLTDDVEVIACAAEYRYWAALVPVAGMAAFIWDGVFVGLTATRQMLLTLFLSTLFFFVIYFFCVNFTNVKSNDILWLSFISYLASRGLTQTVIYSKALTKRFV